MGNFGNFHFHGCFLPNTWYITIGYFKFTWVDKIYFMWNSRANGLSKCCVSVCFKNTFSASCACSLLYYLYLYFLNWREVNEQWYTKYKAWNTNSQVQCSWHSLGKLLTNFNPLTPAKLWKNGTFKQQMAFFGPVRSNFVPILMKSAF